MKINVISQYHPAAALHQPRLWAVMLEDWESLPEKVDDNFVVVKEGFIDAPLYSLDTENQPNGTLGQWSVAYRDSTGQLSVMPFFGTKKHFKFGGQVVMHNAKWDLRVLKAAGMELPDTRQVIDTMILAYDLGHGFQDSSDSSVKRSGGQMVGGLGLKYLARRNLGMQMKSWQEVKDKQEEVPLYNAQDSVATYLLFERWAQQAPKFFWEIDMPLLGAVMAMEDRGIQVDPVFLKKFSESLDKQIAEFDMPINPYAPEQVRSYVYGELGIEPWKFTSTGAPSVEAAVLETINDPLVKKILDYKALVQEKNTYAGNYLGLISSDSRIHSEFKMTRTATGRLSSANPNLQNVVKEGEMRNLFVASPGKQLVRMDFSQLELRVFAALAQDLMMLKAFQDGVSIHQSTADILGIKYSDAKNINFLMLYAGGAWKISEEFHVPIDDAKALVTKYYDSYPGIRAYHNKQIEIANSERKVSTYFGRIRRLDAMFSNDWRVKKGGEREAINTPIQGTAAEIVKIVMNNLHYKHSAPIVLQVHDELLFEVEERHAKDYAKWLEEYVPTIVEINGVKFPVEVGVGNTWREASKKWKHR